MGRVRMLHKEFKKQFNIGEELKLFSSNEKINLHEIEQREGSIGIKFDTEDSFRIRIENESSFEY